MRSAAPALPPRVPGSPPIVDRRRLAAAVVVDAIDESFWNGANLYAGGDFISAGLKPSGFIGRWREVPIAVTWQTYLPLVLRQ